MYDLYDPLRSEDHDIESHNRKRTKFGHDFSQWRFEEHTPDSEEHLAAEFANEVDQVGQQDPEQQDPMRLSRVATVESRDDTNNSQNKTVAIHGQIIPNFEVTHQIAIPASVTAPNVDVRNQIPGQHGTGLQLSSDLPVLCPLLSREKSGSNQFGLGNEDDETKSYPTPSFEALGQTPSQNVDDEIVELSPESISQDDQLSLRPGPPPLESKSSALEISNLQVDQEQSDKVSLSSSGVRSDLQPPDLFCDQVYLDKIISASIPNDSPGDEVPLGLDVTSFLRLGNVGKERMDIMHNDDGVFESEAPQLSLINSSGSVTEPQRLESDVTIEKDHDKVMETLLKRSLSLELDDVAERQGWPNVHFLMSENKNVGTEDTENVSHSDVGLDPETENQPEISNQQEDSEERLSGRGISDQYKYELLQQLDQEVTKPHNSPAELQEAENSSSVDGTEIVGVRRLDSESGKGLEVEIENNEGEEVRDNNDMGVHHQASVNGKDTEDTTEHHLSEILEETTNIPRFGNLESEVSDESSEDDASDEEKIPKVIVSAITALVEGTASWKANEDVREKEGIISSWPMGPDWTGRDHQQNITHHIKCQGLESPTTANHRTTPNTLFPFTPEVSGLKLDLGNEISETNQVAYTPRHGTQDENQESSLGSVDKPLMPEIGESIPRHEIITPLATQMEHSQEDRNVAKQDFANSNALPTPEPTQKLAYDDDDDRKPIPKDHQPLLEALRELRRSSGIQSADQSQVAVPYFEDAPITTDKLVSEGVYDEDDYESVDDSEDGTIRDSVRLENGEEVAPADEPSRSPVSFENELEKESLTLQEQKIEPESRSAGFRTPLSYFASLSTLPEHFDTTIDVFAAVVAATEPKRAKKGPRDYYQTIYITDPSSCLPRSPAAITTVQIFRPYKVALPIVNASDVLILRNFRVQTQKQKPMLLSTDSSAWAVFSRGTDVQMRGPPLEFGPHERSFAKGLRAWWYSLEVKTREDLRSRVPPAEAPGKRKDKGKKRLSEVVHELRDGTKYTDGRSDGMNGIHELRDGTTYVDDEA